MLLEKVRFSLSTMEDFPDFPGLGFYCSNDSQIMLFRDHMITSFKSDSVAVITKVLLSLVSYI